MIALLLTRRLWLLATTALAACGGGGGSPSMVPVLPLPAPREIVYAHYGDSLTSGGTVPRLQAHMPGTVHLDRSYGGMQALHLLDGLYPSPHAAFADHILVDRSDVVTLRFGGQEALNGVPVNEFVQAMRRLIDLAESAGKRVVVIGAINVPASEVVTPEILAHYAALDAAMRELGVPYIDVLGVSIATEEMADPIHPGPAAQERVAAEIAARLAEIIKQLPKDGQ